MPQNELATQDHPIDPGTLEAVIVNGDLSRLNAAQKVAWYRARCEAAGLDPRTQPFQYLSLQGKLTLYATKSATDQLIASRHLTVQITDRRHDHELHIFEVQCRVTFPGGQSVEDFAALSVGGLKGDQLCNALMKCVTKAKRRTVLSACGLGMLDESEVETIPGARVADELPVPDAHHARHYDNGTGHGRTNAYPDPEVVAQFVKRSEEFCAICNAQWLDRITQPNGEIPRQAPAEILDVRRLSQHLIDWGKAEMGLSAPGDVRAGQRDKFAAVLWQKDQQAVIEECRRFAKRRRMEELAKLKPDYQPLPDDDRDVPDMTEPRRQREPGDDDQ